MMSLKLKEAARGFGAAGSEPRLEVLMALVRAGDDGLAVGQIQELLQVPASTLAHHLRSLAAAGLIEQEKLGRAVINRARFEHIEELAGFLLGECCMDAETAKKRTA